MDDLEQRLRKGRLIRPSEPIIGNGLRGMTVETRELAHPDAIEAADTLQRYREALERIAENRITLSRDLQRIADTRIDLSNGASRDIEFSDADPSRIARDALQVKQGA